MTVKNGDKVRVEYKGTLNDGTVFDSSEKQGKPLEFEVGAGQIIPGFENVVKEMKKGDEKEVKLKSSEAYGEHNPQLIKRISKEQLPEGPEPKAGMMLMASLPDGNQVPAKITEVSANDITLDLNHPLAGKDLNFHIKLVDVEASS